jgi:threonine dehydratase
MITSAELENAGRIVYRAMPPTPQYAWPLLAREAGCEVWVKHENHTPIGAFKVRGGLVHMRRRREEKGTGGVITATRGNHGQSIPFAARREGIAATVVVPLGNSREKNAAMRALGAHLIEHGRDFDEAREHAMQLAGQQGLAMVASFHHDLVAGVATYADELFRACGPLDAVYVPIGLGSGICGTIAVRDLRGLATKVIGVVAARAPAYALSFRQERPVASNGASTFADGVAVRIPNNEAVDIILKGADHIVEVSEDEIAAAMRSLFAATHNVAEGAGAAAYAALLKERKLQSGKRVAVILSGGNIDADKFGSVLAGKTPEP